jgi:membrane-bound lytic murein transglycosylase MltF
MCRWFNTNCYERFPHLDSRCGYLIAGQAPVWSIKVNGQGEINAPCTQWSTDKNFSTSTITSTMSAGNITHTLAAMNVVTSTTVVTQTVILAENLCGATTVLSQSTFLPLTVR